VRASPVNETLFLFSSSAETTTRQHDIDPLRLSIANLSMNTKKRIPGAMPTVFVGLSGPGPFVKSSDVELEQMRIKAESLVKRAATLKESIDVLKQQAEENIEEFCAALREEDNEADGSLRDKIQKQKESFKQVKIGLQGLNRKDLPDALNQEIEARMKELTTKFKKLTQFQGKKRQNTVISHISGVFATEREARMIHTKTSQDASLVLADINELMATANSLASLAEEKLRQIMDEKKSRKSVRIVKEGEGKEKCPLPGGTPAQPAVEHSQENNGKI